MNDGNGAARKALLAGGIGNFVEWYDFGLYGFSATTIAHLFFPKSSPTAALLSTFAIFGAAFIVRPLGAIVFGHLGDKIGRRSVLILSVSLMSFATVALGLLPGYAQIGAVAPVLLLVCRLVQGFAAGGEFTGASIFIIEHAPPGRRGRYAAVGYVFVFLASAAGALVSAVMTSVTSPEQLASWGWRVPFISAVPLALIGLYLRLRVGDSPVFAALRSKGHIEAAPVVQALEVAKKPMLILIGWSMAPAVIGYLLTAFLVSYMTTAANFSTTESLLLVGLIYLIAPAGSVLAGYAIDTVGRKQVAVASALCVGIWAVPTFVLVRHGSLLGALLAVGMFAVLYAAIPTTMSLAVVELFPPRVRSSASAVSYNICFAVFGGSAPYVATWLVARGHPLAPGYYIAGLCAVSAVVAAVGIGNRARDTPGNDVTQTPSEISSSLRE